MKIGIISYGLSNVFSVFKTISDIGYNPTVVKNSKLLDNFDKIILPGVGSFFESMRLLKIGKWDEKIIFLVKEKKIPILGICLGMQLLAESSTENGFSKGLSLVRGKVDHLKNIGCKNIIPHVGWNNIIIKKKDKLVTGLESNSDFYFAHSYAYSDIENSHILAVTEYNINIVAIIKNNNIYGMQFHPEKSSKHGRSLLKNFLEI
jgi:glutamine amidotransferase